MRVWNHRWCALWGAVAAACSSPGADPPLEDPELGLELAQDTSRFALGVAPDGVLVEVGEHPAARWTWVPTGDAASRAIDALSGDEPVLGYGVSLAPSTAVALRRSGAGYEISVLEVGAGWTSWALPFNVLSVSPEDVVLRTPTEVLVLDSLIGPRRCTPDGCQVPWTGVPDGAQPLAWADDGVRFAWLAGAQACTGVFDATGPVGAQPCVTVEPGYRVAPARWQDPAAVQLVIDRARPDLAAMTLYTIAGDTLVRGATLPGTGVAITPGARRVHLASPDWSTEITWSYVPTLHAAEAGAFGAPAVDDFTVAFDLGHESRVEPDAMDWRVVGTTLMLAWTGTDPNARRTLRLRRIPLPASTDPLDATACTLACPDARCDLGRFGAPQCESPNPYFDPITGRPIVSVRANILAAGLGAGDLSVTAQPVSPAGAEPFHAEAIYEVAQGRGTALWMLPEYTTWNLRVTAPGHDPLAFDGVVLPSAGDLVDLGEHTLEVSP